MILYCSPCLRRRFLESLCVSDLSRHLWRFEARADPTDSRSRLKFRAARPPALKSTHFNSKLNSNTLNILDIYIKQNLILILNVYPNLNLNLTYFYLFLGFNPFLSASKRSSRQILYWLPWFRFMSRVIVKARPTWPTHLSFSCAQSTELAACGADLGLSIQFISVKFQLRFLKIS